MMPRHPASADLLLHALGMRGEEPPEATAGHVAACPDCQAEVERLREATGALRAVAEQDAPRTSECLDELALAELVDVGATATPPTLAHLARCAHCRRALADLVRLLSDPRLATETERLERALLAEPRVAAESARLESAAAVSYLTAPPTARAPRRRRILPVGAAVALAAAAVAVVLLRPASAPVGARGGREQAQYRDDAGTSPAPVPLAPVGAAKAPLAALRWTGVPRADRYRVVVYDQQGGVVWEAESGDTLLPLPPRVELRPGAMYLWKVEARVSWDRWVGSELTAFTVRW